MEITFSIILWLTVAGLMGLGILTIWNIVVYGFKKGRGSYGCNV